MFVTIHITKQLKRLNKRLEKINLGKTQFISIESGNFPKDKNCKGGKGKNHNFQDSKKDLGEKVINFIETNS